MAAWRLPTVCLIIGGIITLLDGRGLKVDGVSYTAQQAQREGWTLVF